MQWLLSCMCQVCADNFSWGLCSQGTCISSNSFLNWLTMQPIPSWTKNSALCHLLLSTGHSRRSAWHKQTTAGSFISQHSYIAGGHHLKDTKINGSILQQLFGVSMWVLRAILKFTRFLQTQWKLVSLGIAAVQQLYATSFVFYCLNLSREH